MKELFKKIDESFPKNIRNNGGLWIYKNKTIVFDIEISGNKLAFDLEVDEKKSLLKVWMFSRNNLDLPEVLRKKAIKIEKNKLLILDGKFEENEAIEKIKSYLQEVKNG